MDREGTLNAIRRAAEAVDDLLVLVRADAGDGEGERGVGGAGGDQADEDGVRLVIRRCGAEAEEGPGEQIGLVLEAVEPRA